MSYTESELLPLSALQHLLFCERQCALIHIEQAWAENRFTAEGRILHDNVHERGDETRAGVSIARALPLRSFVLGLSGIADVVEFQREAASGVWQPFPVEYKRGKPKAESCDTVQLCAQAMCLEEMLGVEIPKGALFYGKTRRRLDVVFDDELRKLTTETARRLHELIRGSKTPSPRYDARCEQCSLLDLCMPKAMRRDRKVADYIDAMVDEVKV
ncbi:MAG: CRISPR-associated protein Cas4 [Proteobacteria bacterium]|nr:CRISPR-associated protein Cas4 [Pseudomonadota bacterium]